jgi:methionyl-tRNA formyltransferase
VNWAWSAKEIERFICAFDDPYRGASTFLFGRRLFLKNCRDAGRAESFHPIQAGLVFRRFHGGICVAVGHGAVTIRRVCDEYGNDVTDALKPGDRLHTPTTVLDAALEFRAVYTPSGLRA